MRFFVVDSLRETNNSDSRRLKQEAKNYKKYNPTMIGFVTKMRTWIERKYAESKIYLTFEHNINVRFTQLFSSFTDKNMSVLFLWSRPICE